MGRRLHLSRSFVFVSGLTLSLIAGLLTGLPPAAAAEPAGPDGDRSMPVTSAKPGLVRDPVASQTDGPGVTAVEGRSLPGAASSRVPTSDSWVKVGGLPVAVSTVVTAGSDFLSEARLRAGVFAGGPAEVQVTTEDPAVAQAAGVRGVILSVSGSAPSSVAGSRLRIGVDYSAFRNAFGADFAGRLRLVSLPACVLATPQRPQCQTHTVLGSVNQSGRVTGEFTLDGEVEKGASAAGAGEVGQQAVLAVTSSSSSAGATFSETSLSPAYSWSAGGQGGSFSWSYPLKVPASLGGPAPDVALQYDSGSVDAQTLAQNGQTSWVGEGWDLQTGFIERSYRPCAQNGNDTGDLCWFSPYNATLVFQGRSNKLIRDNATGVWKTDDDNGLRVEQLFDTSLGNGDNDGEYWRITTLDGTQYWFGKHKRYASDTQVTNSVQTVPVYGNNSGEPCYNATFANAWCQQGYRWNLDYVVDARGNSMTLFYTKFTGYYGRNNNTGTAPYVISSNLDHIDYGTRAGSEAASPAPMQVWFSKSNRCIGGCSTSEYPDTPWDLHCTSSTSCPHLTNPVFWTRYKLSSVYTQVRKADGSGYRKVDQWDLTHTYPATGDHISPAGNDTSPNLWLQTLTHKGYAEDGVTMLAEPAITFGGTALFNREDWGDDLGVPPYTHYRLSSILNGVGGQTVVAYSGELCPYRSLKPDPGFNPFRCFPQYFKPQQAPSGWGWFHKYVVTSVTEKDLTAAASLDEVWSYDYSVDSSTDPALWGHDFAESVVLDYRSWPLWRGYTDVTTTHGAAGGTQTVSKTLYHRGMHGDTADTSVWDGRRAFLITPLGTPGVTGSIGGVGELCLDTPDGSTGNGTGVRVSQCGAAGDSSQIWQYNLDTTSPYVFTFKHLQSGRCLDVDGAASANGTKIQLWDCNGGAAQVWKFEPNGTLKNPNSGRCLDIAGASIADGALVHLWDCHIGWNQMWQARDDGKLVSSQSRRCAAASGGGTTNATKIITWMCKGSGEQLWRYSPTGSSLINPQSGKCLAASGGGTANGTPIILWTCTGNPEQVWVPQADGTLKNPISGRCLDASPTPSNGDQLMIWDCNGQLSIKWTNLITDSVALQGKPREEFTMNGSSVIGSTIRTYTVTQTGLRSKPVTGGQDLRAFSARETDTKTRTWIDATSSWRWTDTTIAYDTYGLITDIKNLGDMATVDDDNCLHIDYNRNTSLHLINLAKESITTTCAATPGDGDFLEGRHTYYDNATTDATPTKGLVTKTMALASVSAGVKTWKQTERTSYDTHGRITASFDALNRQTTTVYTPASGAPVTTIATTGPMGTGWTTTMTVEPGHGSPKTVTDVNGKVSSGQYDPLGRLVKAWQNDRPTSATPDRQYTYTLASPSWVQTRILGPSGNQISSYQIFDGRLRPRQTQSPTPTANGGRMITDAQYDGRGMIAKESSFYNNSSGPSSTLATVSDANVPTQHRFTYDNLGRKTHNAFYSKNTFKWQTTYVYEGDRSAEIQPAGGLTTQTIFNARGDITSVRHYNSVGLGGTFTTSSYTYDRMGALTGFADPAGNRWSRSVDMRGRLESQSDPDSGTSTYTYDDAGQRLTATDSRGVTLAYKYDNLGRQTEEWKGSVGGSGTLLAAWTYDTLPDNTVVKGQIGSSTRYQDGAAYTTGVVAYDDAYRRLGSTVTIPSGHGDLTGTWSTAITYNVDGSPASVTYPAALGLGVETVTYTYDTNGYQLTATGDQTYVSATSFQPWGDLYQMTLGSGSKKVKITTDHWADTRRIKSIHLATENQTTPGTFDEQLSQQYHWDAAGNLTSVDSLNGGSVTDSHCFRYNQLQEIVEAWTTTPAAGGCATNPTSSSVAGPDAYWSSYTYDTSGNRTSTTNHGLGGATDTVATYTYPSPGTSSIRPHAVTSVAVAGPGGNSTNTFTYNDAGHTSNRTIAGLSTDYTWSDGGQIDTITVHEATGDKTTNFLYTASGDKLMKTTTGGSTLYLGGTELSTNSAGTLTGITRYYLCNGAVVASRSNLNPHVWQAANHQGTAQIAVDSATLATTKRNHDAFGNPRGTQPTWPNPKGFVGGTAEPGGLVHLGARLYDPSIGRFLNPDKINNVADPQQANGYAYAGNNPTTRSDPSGLDDGSPGAHGTAIAMRMQALAAQYPGAIIYGDVLSQGGPDLICWGCEPGEVWVWEFKSENNRSGVGALAAQISGHVAQAKASPLSSGLYVRPGPTFLEIGLPYAQSMPNGMNPRQLVTVYDAGNIQGLQLYRTERGDEQNTAAKYRRLYDALAFASRKSEEAVDVGHVVKPKPQTRSGTGSRKSPKKSPATANRSYSKHQLNSERRRLLNDANYPYCGRSGYCGGNDAITSGGYSDAGSWGFSLLVGLGVTAVVGCFLSIVCGVAAGTAVGTGVLRKSMFTLAS